MMGVGAFLIDKFQIDCAAILFGRYRPIKKISSVYNQIIMYNKELTLIQLFSFCFALYFIGLTPGSLTPIYSTAFVCIRKTRLQNAVKINGSEMIVDFKETTGYACILTRRLLQKKSVYITSTDALCSYIIMAYWMLFWDIC